MTADEIESIIAKHEMQRIELKESFDAECIETPCAFRDPVCEEHATEFRVTYPTRTVESVAKLGLEPYHFGLEKTNKTPTRPGSDRNPTGTRPEILSNLAPSCGLVYDAIEKDNRLTYRMMAETLKLNKDTVNTAVQTLIDHRLLRHIGPKKDGHWEIVEQSSSNGGNDIGS